MQALIGDPQTPPQAAPGDQAPPPAHPCANCGAPMLTGQDWCLECGTAAPGRLGGAMSLRSSAFVVGLTLLIVAGAVAASYAALSSHSRHVTQTVAVAPATPVPVTPAPTAPVTPATTAPATVPGLHTPTTTPAIPTTPHITATPTPVHPLTTPPVVHTLPTTTTHTTTTPHTTTTTPKPVTGVTGKKILLDTDAASTYNPYAFPDSSFGDPALAIDGDPKTAWTYTLDPARAGKTAVGLAIDLKSPQKVSVINVVSTSPGMTVELYGATSATKPVSITDPAWIHIADRLHIKARAHVGLKTHGKQFQILLLWIKQAPPAVTTGTVGFAEVSVIH